MPCRLSASESETTLPLTISLKALSCGPSPLVSGALIVDSSFADDFGFAASDRSSLRTVNQVAQTTAAAMMVRDEIRIECVQRNWRAVSVLAVVVSGSIASSHGLHRHG